MTQPTPEDVMCYCETLLRRAGLTALQLVQYMGETIPGAKAAPRLRDAPSLTLATTLAARPDGFAVMELADALGGRSRSTAYTHVQRLEINGVIYPATHPGNAHVMRWFASPAAAAEWTERQRGKPAPVIRAKVGKQGAELVAKNHGTVSPAATAKPALRGEAVIPDNVRITRDTTNRPTARWQMQQEAPDERWPSFASTPLGVNPDTGKAWA